MNGGVCSQPHAEKLASIVQGSFQLLSLVLWLQYPEKMLAPSDM
jgi:hypothetical protein